MQKETLHLVLLPLLLSSAIEVSAQESAKRSYFVGTAVIQVADGEYTLPIDCYAKSRPDLGFTTEPNQVTRLRTGRLSPIDLSITPRSESEEMVIALDGYVARIPRLSATDGTLSLSVDLSREDTSRGTTSAVAFTRDNAANGLHDADRVRVRIDAQCEERSAEAPAHRTVKSRPGGRR